MKKKQGWEEDFRGFLDFVIEDDGNKNEVVEYVKNLLSEREVFTKEELFMLKLAINDIHNKGNSAYDEIGEKIKRELSK